MWYLKSIIQYIQITKYKIQPQKSAKKNMGLIANVTAISNLVVFLHKYT